eukprot:1196124-Prorocentrum_minimum.AAC.1
MKLFGCFREWRRRWWRGPGGRRLRFAPAAEAAWLAATIASGMSGVSPSPSSASRCAANRRSTHSSSQVALQSPPAGASAVSRVALSLIRWSSSGRDADGHARPTTATAANRSSRFCADALEGHHIEACRSVLQSRSQSQSRSRSQSRSQSQSQPQP